MWNHFKSCTFHTETIMLHIVTDTQSGCSCSVSSRTALMKILPTVSGKQKVCLVVLREAGVFIIAGLSFFKQMVQPVAFPKQIIPWIKLSNSLGVPNFSIPFVSNQILLDLSLTLWHYTSNLPQAKTYANIQYSRTDWTPISSLLDVRRQCLLQSFLQLHFDANNI